MKIAFSEVLNRGRFETRTSKPEIELIHATQVHGTDIVSPETLPCEADGIFSSWDKLNKPLAMKTADCLPIVIEGETGVVFLHAGWRGLAHGILSQPEVVMIKPLRVFIGPSIHECCFEVSQDFQDNFPGSPNFKKRNEKFIFNLQDEAKKILREQFPDLLIQVAPVCTCCNENFYSYRRNKTTERNWNLYIKG
jgi:YfiH family protein